MKNLIVPYKSQWDDDAGKTNNDCGPACVAMVLNYYGENLTTNEVFDRTGADKGLITVSELRKAIYYFKYTSNYLKNCSEEDLKSYIDKDIPPIVLVHYGDLTSRQDKKYTGGHFVLVVGYRSDGFFVNDPDFRGDIRYQGDHHFYTKDEFMKAWGNCSQDKNQNYSLLYINMQKGADLYYKGINTSDIESVKKCIDLRQDVLDGKYKTLGEYHDLEKKLKQEEGIWKDRVKNEKKVHTEFVRKLASPDYLNSTQQEPDIFQEVKKLIQIQDDVSGKYEPKIKEQKELLKKIAVLVGTSEDGDEILKSIEKLKENKKIKIVSPGHSRLCAWLARKGF